MEEWGSAMGDGDSLRVLFCGEDGEEMEQRRCAGLLLGAGQRRAQGTERAASMLEWSSAMGVAGEQGRRSEVEEGARAHEGELLLLAELRHGQRSGDSRGEVRASSCC